MACPLHTRVSAGKATALTSRRAVCWSQRISRDACITASFEASRASSSITTTLLSSDEAVSSAAAGAIRVKVTPPRPASPPPEPPKLIHSPVYVQKALKKSSADAPAILPPASGAASLRDELDEESDAQGGNSLLWALKQVDRSLDELEQNPMPLQKEIYEISRGPVGTATTSALTTAAKVTVAATKEAVKAAVPVGQWVMREGAKAAVTLMSRAMAESAKLQQQQQQQSAGKKGKKK